MKGKVLIVAAHPDDEVLGCGGTIARLVKEGHTVCCLILSEGVASRYKKREKTAMAKIANLKSEAKQAAKTLGLKKVIFKNFPDNSFDTVQFLKIVKTVEEVKKEMKPDIIYTHHQGDLNIDHRITFEAVLTACRPLQDETVKEIYAFEVPSSTDWSFQQFEPVFRPNVFVDITDTLKNKVQALRLYESEARPFPHPRSTKVIKTIALRWGSVAGRQAAEAFELIRQIK